MGKKKNQEVNAKIVFYGPSLSGKTSTLRKVYETVRKGEEVSGSFGDGHTHRSDLLPLSLGRVSGCNVNLQLFGAPGQEEIERVTRILVLKRSDAVVFVADSRLEMMDANREALAELEKNLLSLGMSMERSLRAMQWNKRDLPSALPVAQLREALNPRGLPDFETEALTGRGVMDMIERISQLVLDDLRAQGILPPPK